MPRIISIDLETTGFGKSDRVVEIGAVIYDTDLRAIVGELETLINPLRNVPEEASMIHGLKASDLSLAPTFGEIADNLRELFNGATILAHNAEFDVRFLAGEFARLGIEVVFPDVSCTYKLTGQSLAVACEQISFRFNHHSAIEDARATLAVWLASTAEDASQFTKAKQVELNQTFRTVTRSQIGLTPLDRRVSVLSKLALQFTQVGIEQSYIGLLDAYLRDLSLSDLENVGLTEFAQANGLSHQLVIELHDVYLASVETAILRDGIITSAEAAFYNQIASALGISRTLKPQEVLQEVPAAGALICVTGTAMVNGVHYNKKTLETFLQERGYRFTDSISKKSGVALLLQESEGSQSSKVAKAQSWGIPRMVIADFIELVTK
jgi:DNA polymerase-3 subunit epsilon